MDYMYLKNNLFNYAHVDNGVFVNCNNSIYGCNFNNYDNLQGHVYMLYNDNGIPKSLMKSSYSNHREINCDNTQVTELYNTVMINPHFDIHITFKNLIDTVTISLYDGETLVKSETANILNNILYWTLISYNKVNNPIIKISTLTGNVIIDAFCDQLAV